MKAVALNVGMVFGYIRFTKYNVVSFEATNTYVGLVKIDRVFQAIALGNGDCEHSGLILISNSKMGTSYLGGVGPTRTQDTRFSCSKRRNAKSECVYRAQLLVG